MRRRNRRDDATTAALAEIARHRQVIGARWPVWGANIDAWAAEISRTGLDEVDRGELADLADTAAWILDHP